MMGVPASLAKATDLPNKQKKYDEYLLLMIQSLWEISILHSLD